MRVRCVLAAASVAGILASCVSGEEQYDDDGGDDSSTGDDDSLPDDDSGIPTGPVTFVEDFTDTTHVALADAPIDTSGTGWATAPAGESLEDPGTGEDGAWQALADETLPAGEHRFAAFEIAEGVGVETPGDAVVRVQGSFAMGADSSWTVAGSLTLAVSGTVSIAGSIDCAGALSVHQVEPAGFDVHDNALLQASQPGNTPPNHLRLWTRGSLRIDDTVAMVVTDDTTTAPLSGDSDIRAYGDVSLLGGTVFGADYIQPFQVGETRVWTEGNFTVDQRSYTVSGSGGIPGGARVDVRALGDVTFLDNSWIVAESGGGVLAVRAEGDITLDASSWASNGGGGVVNDLFVEGASVSIRNGGYLYGLDGDSEPASAVTLRASGSVLLSTDGGIHAPDVGCGEAGTIRVDAGGDVRVTEGGYLDAGRAAAGCDPPSVGGDIVLTAGGAVELDLDMVWTGDGDVPGTLDVAESTPVEVVPDAGLRLPAVVTSVPIPMTGETGEVESFRTYGAEPTYARVELWISPDGSEAGFTRVEEAIGLFLGEGWRYRLVVYGRMFDAARADGFELTYR